MQYEDLLNLLEHTGKDPARLIFEDELTGISNRRFLRNYLEHKVEWGRQDFCLSLLLVDLDGFKEINDTYGHEVGDQALVWMAERLREEGGSYGLPIRYAGDEFIVLMPRGGAPRPWSWRNGSASAPDSRRFAVRAARSSTSASALASPWRRNMPSTVRA